MKVGRFLRTVRYLRLRQITARLRFHTRRVSVGEISEVSRSKNSGPWVRPPRKATGVCGPSHYRVLNTDVVLNSASDWNSSDLPKLVLYHLHYHDVLNSEIGPGIDFCAMDFMGLWIAENPPVSGNGWEPYPLSLRIVNWIKWHLDGNRLSDAHLESLCLQARALSQQLEYHLMANHILANAKALYFAGLFVDGAEADDWRRMAVDILHSELDEQVLNDGGHFELSPMYQSTVTEDILDIINIARTFGDESLGDLRDVAGKMIRWLTIMTHGDGHTSYFNDSTCGTATPLDSLVSYAERLGVLVDSSISDGIHHLEESGYFRYQNGDAVLLADIGAVGPDYQPGHAHCDCLSFELSVGKDRCIVNTGISTYDVGDRRSLERLTESHSTVSIDGLEQSEVWSAFRVGRRAYPIGVAVGTDFVNAGHDGFRHAGVTHRRSFRFHDNDVSIQDNLESTTRAEGIAHFHFPPNTDVSVDEHVVTAGNIVLSFPDGTAPTVERYYFCKGFNDVVESQKLCVPFSGGLSTRISLEDSVRNR